MTTSAVPTMPTRPTAPPSTSTSTRASALRRAAAVGALAAVLGGLPTSAGAHVRVVPESTTAQGWTTLTFRVPNESDTAVTTGLAVELPTATPLLFVSTKPVPGWTATVEEAELPEPVEVHGATITQAPVRVVWTAAPGAEIAQGQFQEFEISAGPLPEAGTTIVLPADQTYSDGTVVSWDEVAQGDVELDRPAPVFTTTDDDQASDAPAAGAGAELQAAGGAAPVPARTGSGDRSDPVARGLAAAALLAALVALAVTWRRRTSVDPS